MITFIYGTSGTGRFLIGEGQIRVGEFNGFSGDKLIERGRTYLMKVHTFCADQLEIGVKG